MSITVRYQETVYGRMIARKSLYLGLAKQLRIYVYERIASTQNQLLRRYRE